MRFGPRFLVTCGWLVILPNFAARADDDPKRPAKPYGLAARVPWATSRVVGSPDPPPPYRLNRVFPRLKFDGPVYTAQEPGSNHLLVAELNGKIFRVPIDDPDPAKAELFLDAKRQVYAFSFHPGYRENGFLFVFSPNPSPGAPGSTLSRVSRFETDRGTPRRVVPGSERVIIEWPSGGHNGGEAIVGPDGYLYIGTGDGSSGSDPGNSGQGVDDLHSVIMRIDADHPDPGRNYSIPKDNPFLDHPGARPEIWAHGFRNPWRMSFDPETGRLWVGDVGQDLWEMIWVVRKGGNYGWSVREGSHPFHPNAKAGPGPILPPAVEHHHSECRSITGGYVYHGDKFPELRGAYVYGDYQYGKVWALRYDGQKVTWHRELADTSVFITGFAVGGDGEIYAVDNTTGFVHTLGRTPPAEVAAGGTFPKTLGETGLFASVAGRTVAPGVIPYSVNAPYWADGANLERHLALPGKTQIPDAQFSDFPDGTVAVQTLSLDLEPQPGQARARAPVETRLLVKQDGQWLGYTYLWNDARTDATLVGANGAETVLVVHDPSAPGGSRRQTWLAPGRNECMFCHSRAAGFVLGLKPAQMNRDHDYGGGVVDHQTRALGHAGLFKNPPPDPPPASPRFVDPYDDKADPDDRARTYLHVNCSICHVADGGGNSPIELAHGNTLEATRAVGGRPVQGTFGLTDARVVAPGAPERSVLYYRMATLGGARMPRVGSRVVDETGLDLIAGWIARLPDPGASAASKSEREETAALLRALRDGEPPARADAVRRLTSTTSRAVALSLALGHGHDPLPAPARAEALAAARDHPSAEVRDLFERFLPESERARRLGDHVRPDEVLSLRGDPARGRALFAADPAVNCKSCHRLDGVGVALGPDLGKVGAKYPRADLLRHVLEPSLSVDPKYAVHRLETKSGLVHSGLLAARDDKEVVLVDAANRETRVPAADVETLTPEKTSLMPELLLRGLTPGQAADLLDYLASLR